jgi:hypothetical protein
MKTSISKIIREEIGNYLRNNIILEYLDKDYGIPVYRTAQKELISANVVKTTWLVHTVASDSDAESIMNNGFTNGVSKDELGYGALTNSLNAKRSDRGYAWAYELDDVLMGDCKYAGIGTALLFQASGVEYYNDFDEETQVIFDNKSPKNMILIYEWDGFENKEDKFKRYVDGFDDSMPEDKLFGVGNVNGKPLYIGKFNDVLKWCVTNFRQYAKYLLSNKSVLHANIDDDKFQSDYEDYLEKNGYGELPNNAANKYSKWHSWDEEMDDWNNYNSSINNAYDEYLKQQGWDRQKEKEKLIDLFNSKRTQNGFGMPNDDAIERILDITAPSREEFIGKYQKEHPFYVRRKPGGGYWIK